MPRGRYTVKNGREEYVLFILLFLIEGVFLGGFIWQSYKSKKIERKRRKD